MRTLIFAIALCFLFEKDDARFLEPRCKLGSQFRPNSAIKEKIVDGSDAPRVPWMAAIFNEEKFICGGTLITSRYVLTAAHCIREEKIYVVLGAYNITNCSDPLDVEGTSVHHEFSKDTKENDIALIKLKRKVVFNDMVRPVCISLNMDAVAVQVEHRSNFDAFGWGSTRNKTLSDKLQTLSMAKYDRQECSKKFKVEIGERQICAGSRSGDTCAGDSGGPLVSHGLTKTKKHIYLQWAIVSYGDNDCSGVGVYTNVIKYADWIEEKVSDASIEDQEETVPPPLYTTTPPPYATRPPLYAATPAPDDRAFLDDNCGKFDHVLYGVKRLPFLVTIFGLDFTAKGTIIAKSFVLTNNINILLGPDPDTL
ncbi:uncharacterized protein Dana_GF11318 [Drosophila ananassae]|uniref:Peptidase S1 domain-containing protein n=2 Tax=Drosophila ananassae TaxID=7217 RepID=B3MEL6_DROAN|nr:uncharacterized protein Dana_GF11318 [Drosophila ananassae]